MTTTDYRLLTTGYYTMNIRSVLSIFALTLSSVLIGGCSMLFPNPGAQPPDAEVVPEPINTLLPTQIRIHPFTGLRAFSEKGDIKGLDVRIEAIDAFGDTNKAFGLFRFELYRFQPNSPDPKGPRIAVWNVNIEDFKTNRQHWNNIAQRYQFKLAWNRPIPVGQKFVLITVFQSRFTNRLFAELTFVSEG